MDNLYTLAKSIVLDAIDECGNDRDALDTYIWQSCDGSDVSIYYHKAIQFCADNNTTAGEELFEECGGWQNGRDTFGEVACRIAFGTLLAECRDILEGMNTL
jgi:hypothetical protein